MKGTSFIYISAFFFAFFLPLHTGTSNFFLITILLAVAFSKRKALAVPKRKWRIFLHTTALLFFLHLFGLIYTEFPQEGYRYLGKTISFILVPLVFLLLEKESLEGIKYNLVKGLIWGCSLSLLILSTINLHAYFTDQGSLKLDFGLFDYYHTYIRFVNPLKQHPTYLGVYILTALIFIGKLGVKSHFKLILIVLFGIGILFLNSRITFFGVMLVLLYHLIGKVQFFMLKKKYKQMILWCCGIVVGLFLLTHFFSKTYIGSRFMNIYRFEISLDKERKINSVNQTNPRMARYESAIKLIKEKPVFGYGVADEYPNLKKQFIKDGLIDAANQGYNAHNQYIGYGIRFGVFGILTLIFFLSSNVYYAIRHREYEFLLLIIIIGFVNMVENYFDRNFGITFSALFFTVLLYSAIIDDRQETRP